MMKPMGNNRIGMQNTMSDDDYYDKLYDVTESALTALSKAMGDGSDGKYLIWSNEHNAWWCPDHCGYTSSVDKAGRYSLSEAIEICNGANYGWNTDNLRAIPNEVPISEEAALLLTYRTLPHKQKEGA